MGKYYFIIIFISNFLFSNYLDIQYASFSYTIGGSYGSCVKFKKSQYNFNSYNACSRAWAANVSNYSDCYELYYNPQTKMIKYNLYQGGEYVYRSFASDYSCHIYAEEIESPILDCDEMNEIECSNDNSYEWVENSQSYNCSQFNSSDECNSYGQYGCYTSWNSTTWEDDCFGGSFTIDDSYCQEIIVNEDCSEMNETGCSSDDDCQWIENIELESCNDINSQQECNAVGCSWYNGSYYACTICCWGEYEIDNSYCEEFEYQSGDLNQDNIINIQDIIITVNLVLNSNYDILADMNNDNIINVLDIIQLVNIILN